MPLSLPRSLPRRGSLLTAILAGALLPLSITAEGLEASGGGRHVVPAGQEEIIRNMLDLGPARASGWRFVSASVPRSEIVARFERGEPGEPSVEEPAGPAEEAELRLVHPSEAGDDGAPRTKRFAVLGAEEAEDLLEPLLERIRLREESFVWAAPEGRRGAKTRAGGVPRRSVLERWALSALIAGGALCLVMVAGRVRRRLSRARATR